MTSPAPQPYRREGASAADHVIQDLRRRILSGELGFGDRVPSERDLAATYDVSAATIREAMRALSALNLIEKRQGSGTVVVARSSTLMASAISSVVELEGVDLDEILMACEWVYLAAVRQAAEVGPRKYPALRAAAESFRPEMSEDEMAAALEDFLMNLVGLSGSKLLQSIARFLVDAQIEFARSVFSQTPREWRAVAENLVNERRAIVDAIEAGEIGEAEEAVRAYVQRGRQLASQRASRPRA